MTSLEAVHRWLGPECTRSGEEAVLAIGVSHHERLGVIWRIHVKKWLFQRVPFERDQ